MVSSNYVEILGARTHYLEAGQGAPLILLHGGEVGASAEMSWEFVIEPLSRSFRVIAPDMLGYGRSEKLHSFENFWQKRVAHIAALLRHLDVGPACFAGNSMGGTMVLAEACATEPQWNVSGVISVCGGAGVKPAVQPVMQGYDLSRAHFRKVLDLIVQREDLKADEAYVEKRFAITELPGAWEAASATRLAPPNAKPRSVRPPLNFGSISVPTLIMAGDLDPISDVHAIKEIADAIPASQFCVFEDAGHCPQIDSPERFVDEVVAFMARIAPRSD